MIEKLNKLNACVYAYDPLCSADDALKLGAKFTDSFSDIDCILILTDHKEFYELDLEEIGKDMRNKVIVDGRQVVEPGVARESGFVYKGIGRK